MLWVFELHPVQAKREHTVDQLFAILLCSFSKLVIGSRCHICDFLSTEANFAIRTVGNPANFGATLRHEVRTVDLGLMILGIRDLHSLMDRSLEQTRLLADVSAFFGLLAAALAAIGLYGVMSYDVARRTKEIGIRTALGAQRRDVLGLFLRNGLKLTAVGLALGTGVALALARMLRAFLFGVEPTDPGTCVGVAILFAAVALLACFIPAQRATNVDPMTALRHE